MGRPIEGQLQHHGETPLPMRSLHSSRLAVLVLALAGSAAQAQDSQQPSNRQTTNTTDQAAVSVPGPVRLRQPGATLDRPDTSNTTDPRDPLGQLRRPSRKLDGPAAPGEFELFVQRLAGDTVLIRRFGAELMQPDEPGAETSPQIPSDYLVKPGDELLVTIWGSVDADIRTRVDRNGRITIPRVGPVLVAGVRYADLSATVSQRVGQVFRNFQISVALGQLRAQRVYVTGFVERPGAYSVGSLSTVLNALIQAGGPSAAGSLRQVEVLRAGTRVASLDMYEFLLKGIRSGDLVLQPDDVVHVGPLGTQVGLIGSVNRPAVYELKSGETLVDLLRMAGGFTAVADRTRVSLERLDDRATVRITQLSLPGNGTHSLVQGDVLRAFSAVESSLPVQRQNKRVKVEGEVTRPGEFLLPPQSTIEDALAAAGGLTSSAFLFGTDFSRESVRVTQQQNFDRALRDLEVDLARNTSTQRAANAGDEAALQASRESANSRLVSSLRALRPSGRIVLQVQPDARALPPLALEDGDRIYVPPKPTTVGVFGSVFNGGSYLYTEGRPLGTYVSLAGGPTRGADIQSTFVVRANGTVISGQQTGNRFFANSGGLDGVRAEPGDTVFVPEEVNKTTFVQAAKDWTQILYQFGLGIAGIVSATR
jgi:protein involved in polysaccharide export with SLBB domain